MSPQTKLGALPHDAYHMRMAHLCPLATPKGCKVPSYSNIVIKALLVIACQLIDCNLNLSYHLL
eukprot:3334433-Amphidinium_carterae.1